MNIKYVKKTDESGKTVVKPVSDNLAGAYVAAGWKTADKAEYERTADKRVGNPTPNPRDSREA